MLTITATPISPNAIDVSFNLGGNVSEQIKLYRDGSPIATLAAGTTIYHDTGLTASTLYVYEAFFLHVVVSEVDSGGPGSATTLAVPPPPPPSGLSAPLNDAICFYRPVAGTNSVVNLGTRSESKLIADAVPGGVGPVYTADATLGAHYKYLNTREDRAFANLPASFLNGDITFAIRWRPDLYFNWHMLGSIIDNPGPSPTKHFMIGCQTDQYYLSRFWGNSPTRPQLPAVSTTKVNTGRTDTVVVTWDSATRTHSLYINGVLEGSGTSAVPRTDAVGPGINFPTYGTTALKPSAKFFCEAYWNRCLSSSEVFTLNSNADWLLKV
jgi:hypothetical protein